MNCPYCSYPAIKNGKDHLQNGSIIQTYRCKSCSKRFNERTATPMARLRTPTATVSLALKMRTEGMGIRAAGRVLEKSHSTIIGWEQRVADQAATWSPPAPPNTDVTVEADELYTRVDENLPPLRVRGLDDQLYGTRQSLLVSCQGREKGHSAV